MRKLVLPAHNSANDILEFVRETKLELQILRDVNQDKPELIEGEKTIRGKEAVILALQELSGQESQWYQEMRPVLEEEED